MAVKNSTNSAGTGTTSARRAAWPDPSDWDGPDLDTDVQSEPFPPLPAASAIGSVHDRPSREVVAAQRTMHPGQLIADKYRIERIIGQGGMGTVAAATNVALDQPVALKFLAPEMVGNPTVVERLLREARASAKLRSEHVCIVYDVGLHAGEPFIVMELLDGRDLASMVGTRIALPVAMATEYVLQAAVGLAEAHALGIVHRDLKPANIFLTRRADKTPLIKVLDFGIAKSPTDHHLNLTRTATMMGSPGYMSPEQLRSSRDVDARSDIWALGVILYELTAGKPPFTADSVTALALRIAMDPTPPLPGVPREFERVVARCLEKDPARRFGDVAQLAAALAPFGNARAASLAEEVRCTRWPAPSMPVPPGNTLGHPAVVPTQIVQVSPARRSLGWVVLLGLAVGGGGTMLMMSQRGAFSAQTHPPSKLTSSQPSEGPNGAAQP